MDKNLTSVRLDKWLWAARFYKTRQLAIKALKNGKVSLNKQGSKPSTNVKISDYLTIKSGLFEKEIKVLDLSERQTLKEQLAQQPKIDIDRRKPDKRGVRSHRALKRGGD